jgi:ABC-2 type transport system permease protein
MKVTSTRSGSPEPQRLQSLADGLVPRRGPVAASPWIQLRTLAVAMLRGFFRDRTALFFTFFFPLMFLVVFGLIFRSSGSSATTIAVAGHGPILDRLPAEVLVQQRFASVDAAVAKVRAGDLPAALIEDGNSLTLRFAASDAVKAAQLQGIVQAVVGEANVAASGRPPTFSLTAQQVEDSNLKPIQFLTPGILSWGVATSAAFGAALTLVSWRRKQLLRRVRLSPAPVWTVVGARVGVSVVVALVQAAVFVTLAVTPPFGLRLTHDWWLAIPLLVLGTLAFLSIGLLVGAIAKTDESASAMANFVVLPMAFLSGTFFDITQAPGWLQSFSRVFPLRWMNDGMLDVLGRGRGISSVLAPSAVLLGFTVVVGFVATRVFRWDDA